MGAGLPISFDIERAGPLFGRLNNPVWVFDIDHSRVHWANASALGVWRANSLDELLARDMGADMSESVARRLQQFQQDFKREDARFSEIWTLYPLGKPTTLRVMFSGIHLPDGRVAMLCEGLGELQTDPETLRSAEALLHTTVMITLYSRDGAALYRNLASRDAAVAGDQSLPERFVEPLARGQLMRQLTQGGTGRLVAQVRTSRGQCWHEISARRCRDAVTGSEAWLLSEVDISELKRTEAHAQHLALHDTLTGLPNRSFVMQSFQQRMEQAHAMGQHAALMFIDLDRFKHINDSLGHSAGDQLLVNMAKRLHGQLREHDLAARLGGDEFLVLVAAEHIERHVDQLAQRLLRVVAKPMVLSGVELQVTPSIGVALFPQDGRDIGTLMRHADLAMYRAKDRGRNGVAYFAAEMNTAVRNRMSLETELRHALERREFVVHYQPRVDVMTGRITGAEALVRWQHPERGLVFPDAFIGVCEDAGLIGTLGEQVLEQAAHQQRQWGDAGLNLLVSVNLSSRQFADPELVEKVEAIVAKAGCLATQLELEITESLLLGNDDTTISALHRLRALGFRIALDDFGTGYSNLAYLRRYPLNVLKVDRSFVNEVGEGRAITDLIILMAQALKLNVVAEGVETEEQLAWLRERGCDEYQGYLFSKPVPPARLEALWNAQLDAALQA
jgi:diguanylate cyclase (GGDEF)-like protein